MTYTPPLWTPNYDSPTDAPSPYSYGAGEPSATWRPFNDSSAWNTPIPSSPTIAPDSTSVVTWLNSLNGPVDRYMGQGGTTGDYDHPAYYAASNSPLVRVKFLSNSSDPSVVYTSSTTGTRLRVSDLHNRRIPLPAGATPAGGTDGHMIIETATRSYEMWQGNNWQPGENRYGCAYGAVYDLAGNGASTDGHSATAAGVSLLSGRIRLAELQAGKINHALAMVVKYVRRNVVTGPATGCATPDPATVAGDANDLKWPVTGARFQLNYTESEIEALAVPAWKKVILRAMREYGLIVMDTGGASWNLQFESGAVDVAQGQPDRWRAYAVAQGWSQVVDVGNPYILPLKTGVDWTKLRVVSM